jgi:hypothetical protein
VRARDAEGRIDVLAPPGGRCVTAGVRVVQPWLEGALRSLVLRAPPGVAEPALGDWICHGARFRARGFEAVELVWTQPWVELAGGAEGVANAAFVTWRCRPPGLIQRVPRPDDAQLRALEWRAPG